MFKKFDANHLELNPLTILYKNWVNNKNEFINKPCNPKANLYYNLAKVADKNNPMPRLMFEVFFDKEYNSYHCEMWEQIYLNNDLFIAVNYSMPGSIYKYKAFSLESLYLLNKNMGFLRTKFRFDDEQLTEMSDYDEARFIIQLEERYPSYYQEYLNTKSNNHSNLTTDISADKLNLIFNALEAMIVLSCHKGGLKGTFVTDHLPNELSLVGYTLFVSLLENNFTTDQIKHIKSAWAENIETGAQKNVGELIDAAFCGTCTTTLSLYWLGLLEKYRDAPKFYIDDKLLDYIMDNLKMNPENNNLSKNTLLEYLDANRNYIFGLYVDSRESLVKSPTLRTPR